LKNQTAALEHDHRPVLVLYIGGEGRSGSTVLAAMLGTSPDFFPIGEIRGLWQAIETNELCGCGVAFNVCPFWTRVGARAFGGWGSIDVSRMLAFDSSFARHRNILRLIVPRIRRQHQTGLTEYTAALARIYEAVRDVSECTVLVDSTKDPPYAFLLRQIPQVDLRLIHLVRDSRGVAFSWEKAQVARPEYAYHPTLKNTFMVNRAAWQSALEWDAKNLLLHLLGRIGVQRMLLRYESVAANPAAALAQIASFLSTPRAGGDASLNLIAHPAELSALPHHTLGGNRIRFQRGPLQIRPDVEWRARMPRRKQLAVGTLTLPLLLIYGYLKKS
jgi:hypothetical protein